MNPLWEELVFLKLSSWGGGGGRGLREERWGSRGLTTGHFPFLFIQAIRSPHKPVVRVDGEGATDKATRTCDQSHKGTRSICT